MTKIATIPPRMLHLPRDRRGYPIPVVVLVDDGGRPHFTVNDADKAAECLAKGLCSICGGRLGSHKWFVGGPSAAFHPKGRYIDGPMHQDCATFSLRTCPYLALAGTYAKLVDGKTLKGRSINKVAGIISLDANMTQPSVFVLADTGSFTRTGPYLNPERPWRQVQFWRDGQEIGAVEAKRLILAEQERLAAPFEALTYWQDN
jgi:hypothetical protein